MPPKQRIMREMIVQAAYEIVRENGENAMNARTIAEKLNCSTQPVLYHFKTMDEVREAVYLAADEYHSEYLMQGLNGSDQMNSIWKNYIRFSVEERNLFKLLFQSNSFSGRMQSLFEDERLMPILQVMSKRMNLTIYQVQKVFAAVFFPIHGIASLLANNSMDANYTEYEETVNMILKGVLTELRKAEIHD